MRNYDVSVAAGEILAFIDAVCLAAPSWLSAGVAVIINEKIGIAGSRHLTPENCGWVGRTWAVMSRNRGFRGHVTYIPAGNIFIKKKIFFAVGGFDERLTSSEDVDLCRKIRKKGLEVYSDPEISATHLGDDFTLGQFFEREMWHGADVVYRYLHDRRDSYRNAAIFALYHLFWGARNSKASQVNLGKDRPSKLGIFFA